MAQFVPLFENVEYPQPNTSGGTTESKLVSELSVRIIEYYENQPTRCIRLLNKLLNIYKQSPTAFKLILECLSGSRMELQSYSTIAAKEKTSKQYQHANRMRELKKLCERYPDIARVVEGLLWK